MIKEYEDLKKILKTSEGKELYAHLMDWFNTLVMYYPEDVLDKFEEVSYLLKDDDKGKISKFLNIENRIDHKVKTAWQGGLVSKVESLLDKKQEDGDEPVEAPTAGKVSNLFADFEVFEWAGVSFGSDELFRLQQSLTRLSISSGSERLRFWGKVYGTQKDYYIAEGFVQATDEDGTEKPIGFEERGAGTNQFVYWVTDNPLNNWTMLPDITPDMLKASRAIKVMFTGNLEHQIITNPFFFGLEKHYLRAQIARISHSTSIMPRGLHKTTEDYPMEIEPIEFEDESKKYVPTSATQSHLSNWVHALKSILKWNRVSHLLDVEEFEAIETEEVNKILNTRDPVEPRLKQLTEDVSALENEPAWTLRVVGDQVGIATINGKTII